MIDIRMGPVNKSVCERPMILDTLKENNLPFVDMFAVLYSSQGPLRRWVSAHDYNSSCCCAGNRFHSCSVVVTTTPSGVDIRGGCCRE